MPTLSHHQSNEFVKLLALGDSKVGKTSSLVSLIKGGYKVRILDLDNLLDPLKYLVQRECPDKLDNVEFRSLRDKRVMTSSGPIIGAPNAFTNAIKMLDNWKYTEDGIETDLGKPFQWGPECVLVIDSLSRLCDAAFDWRLPLTPKGGKSGEIDKRMTFFDAQNAIEDVLAMLTGDSFETNVIVICHGVYMDLKDGTTKIFPQGVGQKLSPKIPQYFPSYVRYKKEGSKRVIQLVSDAMIDLACPKPLPTKTEALPAETGLAQFFDMLKEPTKAQPQLRKV